MSVKSIKTTILLFALLAIGLADSGWAITRMNGTAELAYTKYDAEVGGDEIFSGNSLVQKYSLGYVASNLLYPSQPTYYDLNIGYKWMGFRTKAVDLDQEVSLKQSSSSFFYGGGIGYSPPGLPIRFAAQINTTQPLDLTRNLNANNIINDDLVTGMTGTDKGTSSGFQFEFEPALARSLNVQGLPRLLIDYRESNWKSSGLFSRTDIKTKELAVAGLNKENNWVHYRSFIYENLLNPIDRSRRQQIQIGLVDNLGQRKWSSLTNWIEVSADGQLTQMKSPVSDRNLEEYDVNFMLSAARRTWNARTTMNYNRSLDYRSLTESTRVPVYVKGSYGDDTDWRLSLSSFRQNERLLASNRFKASSMYVTEAGLTTFKRSSFTLSPQISLQTSNNSVGYSAYNFKASLETASTRRFSDKLGLFGKVNWRNMDDGLGNSDSKTWSLAADLKAIYRPGSKFYYELENNVEAGKGPGYLDTERELMGANNQSGVGNYLRDYLTATARWTPTAQFSTSLDAAYDVVMSDLPTSDVLSLGYQATYGTDITSLSYGSRFRRLDNGVNAAFISWTNSANITSRPDRNSEGTFRLSHSLEGGVDSNISRLEILQRYSYKFFSRNGVNRILATLTEEYSYGRSVYAAASSPSGQYLQLSGRYNPTERLSLYGSFRAIKAENTITLVYNAGMSVDFKLLSTGVDYTYAKRDSDNRLEKKLAASVRRSF